jgi:hypothetical protein
VIFIVLEYSSFYPMKENVKIKKGEHSRPLNKTIDTGDVLAEHVPSLRRDAQAFRDLAYAFHYGAQDNA